MKKWLSLLFLVPTIVLGQLKTVDLQYFSNVNIVRNPGFENGRIDWQASGGTYQLVTATNVGFGSASAGWTPSASSQTFKSTLAAIPQAMQSSTQCSLSFYYKGSDSNLNYKVVDQSNSTVAGSVTLSTASNWSYQALNFTCPSSGSLQIVFTSTAASAIIYLDQFQLGLAPALGLITNANVASNAAIAYSKLALGASIVNSDVSNSAAIAYSKLALSASIVNADVSGSAAIALNKLAALTNHSRALQSDSSGFIAEATTTSTELGFLSGVTSAIQTQLNLKVGGTATAKSADYTILDGDGILSVYMTTSSTNRVVTLPLAANNTNRILTIKKVDSGTGKCTVTGNGSENIDGVNTFVLVDQDDYVTVQDTGTAWIVLAKGIGLRAVSRVRDEGGAGHGSTNTKIRRIEVASVVNTGNAITRATSATNGNSYTINQNGWYAISYSDRNTAAGTEVGISKNSAQLTTNVDSITNTTRLAYSQNNTAQNDSFVSTTLFLSAGDVIRPHTDGTPNISAVDCNFEISKVGL